MYQKKNELFSQRFLIKTARLNKWDYSSEGYYFITICTINRINYFGNIINRIMILSDIGNIAQNHWQQIPQHFPNILLDEYIIMPNHVHGIIQIIKSTHINNKQTRRDEACHDEPVETCHGMSLQNNHSNKFSHPIHNSIPMIINHFKGSCTRAINQLPNQTRLFQWQTRYYDRVIRDDYELNKIREYIINNPKKIN